MAPSYVPPFQIMIPAQAMGLKLPPNVPFSGPKNAKANVRTPIELAEHCAQLLENEALVQEWTSIYGPL